VPADIIGTRIYKAGQDAFETELGPVFANFILTDEINRAPAKVQSALLEAMAERQITVGRETYPLPQLFLVMATQNPIEQEGTYPLPEAQLDRFLMHVRIGYPDPAAEQQILQLVRREMAHPEQIDSIKPISQQDLFAARKQSLELHMAPNLEQYLLQLVLATRTPAAYGDDLAQWIQYGASPRGTIALDRCARVHAWLSGRDYVTPDDIQTIAYDTLRHRILLNYEAQAEGITPDYIIEQLIARIAVP
jgi:MoxR-like ATPase